MSYACVFLGLQLAALFLVIFLASTPWFLTHDDYPWLQQQGYGIRLMHQDCDVVIIGDSTPLGLNPDIIRQITGLKTCNITESVMVPTVVGSNYLIDEYLKHNKRPRFLLGMYSAWRFEPNFHPFADFHGEGVVYGLQYIRSREFYIGFFRRPIWVAKFGVWAGHLLIGDLIDKYVPGFKRPVYSARAEREKYNGWWLSPEPGETTCKQMAQLVSPHYGHHGLEVDPGMVQRSPGDVAAFRNRYSVGGTTVIVDVTPTPDCAIGKDILREHTEGLHDNAFEIIPVSYFNDWDVHFSQQGSRYISTEVGNQILALEKQQDAERSPAAGAPR